jgi:TolB-like protein/Flp pilus assembly protein TadD
LILLIVIGRNIFFPGHHEAIDSIAVLPLANLSGDPEQEYFADGMTEALIANLGKIGALRVISRQSVMRYKGSDKPLPEIARELNVDAVVEGTVVRSGDKVRITAQLIEAATDRHLWVESYERDLRDVLALQSEVARAIAREIEVELTSQEQVRLVSARPVDPEAYELYLRGRYHYDKWTKEGFENAIEYFQKAIEADPNYAQAYAALANSNGWLWFMGYLPPEEYSSRFTALIKKALEIDDALPEAHLSLAQNKFYYKWDWMGAEPEFKRAIEHSPSLVEAHQEYAFYLTAMGRLAEAMAEAKRAQQLDPFSYPVNETLGMVYYNARQYDQAIAQYRQAAELEPNNPRTPRSLARIYEQMGRYEDAVTARQRAMTLSGDPPEEVEALARAYSEPGPEGYWMWRLERLKGRYVRNPSTTAAIYAHLGDKDQAFAWLEKAYAARSIDMIWLKVNPLWDSLRSDPRFQDLLRRMNFPE